MYLKRNKVPLGDLGDDSDDFGRNDDLFTDEQVQAQRIISRIKTKIKEPIKFKENDELDNVEARGEVLTHTDENGNEYIFTKKEASNVIEVLIADLFERKIEAEGHAMVRRATKTLKQRVDCYVNEFINYTTKYLDEQIDKAAEDIALKLIEAEINGEIEKRVQEKLEKLRKEL